MDNLLLHSFSERLAWLAEVVVLSLFADSIFGASLLELVQTEASLVPKFLTYFIEHIEKNDLDAVGLYRLSGNAALVQKLRFLVEKSEWNSSPSHNYTST